MKDIIKKDNYLIAPERKTNRDAYNDEISTIKLPTLEGDTQIYLGQTIVTLIRIAIENKQCYSKKTQHYFKIELMASILEELNISTAEIEKAYRNRSERGDVE